MNDYHQEARARREDPETSHEAAEAITPHLNEIQAAVERFALRQGPHGFTDLALSEAMCDDGSTARTRRAELTDRNLILDSGQRRKHGDSERNRILWVHRRFVDNPPPLVDPTRPTIEADRIEARAWVGKLQGFAKQMRSEGRAGFADELESASGIMARLAG